MIAVGTTVTGRPYRDHLLGCSALTANRDRQDSADAFFAQAPTRELTSRADRPLDSEQLNQLLDKLADHLGGRQEWDPSSPLGRL